VAFLRANTDRRIKITVPGAFTMAQQAQNDFYKHEVELAMDYAAAVNEEIRDLFAAGADVIQIDEPYMQARPAKAKQYGIQVLNRALDGVTGSTAVHICFGYAAIIHERPATAATNHCGRRAVPEACERVYVQGRRRSQPTGGVHDYHDSRRKGGSSRYR
jgi:methionine synthase II (cobalamin-independent)